MHLNQQYSEPAWTGGCIFANFPIAWGPQIWLSKDEYDESGPDAIRKFDYDELLCSSYPKSSLTTLQQTTCSVLMPLEITLVFLLHLTAVNRPGTGEQQWRPEHLLLR